MRYQNQHPIRLHRELETNRGSITKRLQQLEKKNTKQKDTEEVDEIINQLNNIEMCEEVQQSIVEKAKIDELAVDEGTLAEDIDDYIDENARE